MYPDKHNQIASASSQSYRALLVDDESLSQALGKRLLQNNGFQVEVVASGSEALLRCQHQHYDLIIVDYYLQDTRGDVLLEQLKGLDNSLGSVCIVTTNDLSAECMQSCRGAGATMVLAKPLTLAHIMSISDKLH